MFIKIICIAILLEFSLSDDAPTLPMIKDSKYGDDVCSYTQNNHKYVKHCKEGKFCDNVHIDTLDQGSIGKFFEESNIEICQELPNISSLYTYNEESCTSDFECESGYKCIGNVCSVQCNTGFFYSSNGCMVNSLKGTDGVCIEITERRGESPDYKYSPKEANKVCGKLIFADVPNDNKRGIYYVNKYEYVYKGGVDDGEYVMNKYLCKSGFALYFYKDGKSEDPKDDSTTGYFNTMYLRCVTPISISIGRNGECLINYKINENGETLRYNVDKLSSLANVPSTVHDEIDAYCNGNTAKYIKLQSEKYREYYTTMTEEERKTCGDLDQSNKYTCKNNELIKSWFFYNNPERYSAYNDRKKIRKVVDYLIQKTYPCYSLSQFLSIKFFYLLFLLLF